MTRLYNMWVPHTIRLYDAEDVAIRTLRAHGPVPRLVLVDEQVDEVAGVQLFSRTTVRCSGLPRPRSDAILIVPAEVALAIGDRADLVYPARIITGSSGEVIGAKGLVAGRGMHRRYRFGASLRRNLELDDANSGSNSRDELLVQAREAVAAAVEAGATKTMIAHAMGIALPSLSGVLRSRRSASQDYLRKIIGIARCLSE